jgi:hypothetical protein
MLAEDIGGWLVAGAFLFGGLAASLIALIALFPAWRGKGLWTFVLVAPAAISAMLALWWLADGYMQVDHHNEEEIWLDYTQPGLIMAGIPACACLLALSVLWIRKYQLRNPVGPNPSGDEPAPTDS